MPKIVISYRRTESDATGRIYDRLKDRYGANSVFRDIDKIPFGIDFRKAIDEALGNADVLVAVVGPKWKAFGEDGAARIHHENDLVRIEIETALRKEIPLIPILVGGAKMPEPTDLPESIREFSFRNAAVVDSGVNFESDTQRIMRSIDLLIVREPHEIWVQSQERMPATRPQGPTDIDASEAETYYRMGLIELGDDKYESAIALFERAADLHPTWSKPIIAKAICLEKLGRWDDAFRQYRASDHLVGSSGSKNIYAGVLLNHACQFLPRRQYQKACTIYERIIELYGDMKRTDPEYFAIDPGYQVHKFLSYAHLHAAECYRNLGNPTKELSHLRRWADIDATGRSGNEIAGASGLSIRERIESLERTSSSQPPSTDSGPQS